MSTLGLAIDPESIVLVIMKILFAIGVATLSWHVFEKPILKLKNRFTLQNHPAQSKLRISAQLAVIPHIGPTSREGLRQAV